MPRIRRVLDDAKHSNVRIDAYEALVDPFKQNVLLLFTKKASYYVGHSKELYVSNIKKYTLILYKVYHDGFF